MKFALNVGMSYSYPRLVVGRAAPTKIIPTRCYQRHKGRYKLATCVPLRVVVRARRAVERNSENTFAASSERSPGSTESARYSAVARDIPDTASD